jgi:hypothetical protein
MNSDDSSWAAARRIESWAGEVRVNLIRLAAILAFYGYHLLNYYVIKDDPTLTPDYHTAATSLVLAWSCAVVLLHFCLTHRYNPAWLKYAATVWDALIITALLILPGDYRTVGPRSPLVALYFLLIAAAPLRLSLHVVYVATFAAMGGYLIALGYYAYVLVGYHKYYSDPAVRISRTQEVILLLALGAAGLLAGQVVRQMRRVAEGYPVSVGERGEARNAQ